MSPAATLPAVPLDLLHGLPLERWVLRAQSGDPTCVPHAVAACLELMRARQPGGAFSQLSARFVHQRIRAARGTTPAPLCEAQVPPGATANKLCEAARVLTAEGIPTKALWPEVGKGLAEVPTTAVLEAAHRLRPHVAHYQDHPNPALRPPGLARALHAELAAGRPVAVALAGYRDRAALTGPTNWDRWTTWLTGKVPDPGLNDIAIEGSGHAVCLVGFQPDPTEALGGWFVFRNSWGMAFGRQADDLLGEPAVPVVPRPGYGVLSARHVEHYCWESLSLRL